MIHPHAPLATALLLSALVAVRTLPDEPPTTAEVLMDVFDADGDGRIDRFEAAAVAMWTVDELDEDDDGAMDEEELAEMIGWLEQGDFQETRELLKKYDADGDRVLSLEEVPEAEREVFGFADEDGDDRLTPDEMNAAFEAWAEEEDVDSEEEADDILEDYDVDEDGTITPDEVEGDELADDFAFLDGDGDGTVTRTELVRFIEIDMGPARFEVKNEIAVMTGTIGPSTPAEVLRLLLMHPEVTTIELKWVPGSMDDLSNLWAMRWVRRHGLNTHVPVGGMIASGGTDFLLAGVQRTVAEGARVGVHSWDGGSVEGRTLPRDHEHHQPYLEVCRAMEVPPEYYWFTLDAAPADGIHWTTREELVKYKMVTE